MLTIQADLPDACAEKSATNGIRQLVLAMPNVAAASEEWISLGNCFHVPVHVHVASHFNSSRLMRRNFFSESVH